MISLGELLLRGIEGGYIRKDIQVLPTIFFLWSGISETIRFADQKQKYFQMRLGMTKTEYMDYSFHMLLRSIRGEVEI